MAGDRPSWPRWARNLFVLQLLLNVVAMISFPVLHFSGQAKDHALRLATETKVVECREDVRDLREKLDGAQLSMSDDRSEVKRVEKEFNEKWREYRLFQDFVEGRIGKWPYRQSTERGSE